MVRSSWRPLACGLLMLSLWSPCKRAHAQENSEETAIPVAQSGSGQFSLLGGRPLGIGQHAIGGSIGWPGVFGQWLYAPTHGFDLGLRAGLLYGSSIMGLEAGIGAEVSIPMRLALFTQAPLELALSLRPVGIVSEASLVGEGGTLFAGDLGWSARIEAGVNASYAFNPELSGIASVRAQFGVVHTPDAGGPEAIGGLLVGVGAEGLLSVDALLFVLLEGGIGFSADRGGRPVFRQSVSPTLRISVGGAYRL